MVLRDVAFLFKKSLKASLNVKDWETRSTLTQNRIPSNHGIIIIFDPFYTILSEKFNLRRFSPNIFQCNTF